MTNKIVLIMVSLILIVIIMPGIMYSFLNIFDGMLYILTGIFFNMLKLFILIGVAAIVILTIVLIIKGIKASK